MVELPFLMSATRVIMRALRSESGSAHQQTAMPPRSSAAPMMIAPARVTGVLTPRVGMLATW